MNWHEMIHLVLANLRTTLKMTILSSIFTIIVLVLIYPKTYKAEVLILPPEKNNQLSGLGSLIGGIDIGNLFSGGLSSASSQLYGEILKSRSASLYVIRKLHLVEFFNAENEYEACEKLNKNLNVDISKEGVIQVSVDVTSKFFPLIFDDTQKLKVLSAKISNAFAEALDKINKEKISSKAKNARIYIESQLTDTKLKLDSAEYALKEFQVKNKAISLPDQVQAIIKSTAELKSEIVKTEIELNLLRTNVLSENKSYLSLQKKLEALQEQYSNIEIGGEDYMLAFKDIPELGRELAGLIREVKIQNEVYLMLEQQFFKEKIQENRDVSVIQVLDTAIPPRKAASPKVLITALFACLFYFVLFSFFAVVNQKGKIKVNL